eukprot:56250-Eustigmatos_ZCMA.PRE.1
MSSSARGRSPSSSLHGRSHNRQNPAKESGRTSLVIFCLHGANGATCQTSHPMTNFRTHQMRPRSCRPT